ncbi:MAG: RNA methyltransferase [Ignavibacteria bacterium RBG_13_36_8]|nr:MAG: RNA methyltransferase [Ignavibacteria bacterium RBG_13_36_8]
MRLFKTEKRLEKITSVIKSQQHSLGVILENIHDPHNVSAIFRTCDAVGVPKVGLLYTKESFPQLSKISSSSAVKWIGKEKFDNTKNCFSYYHGKGFKIFSSLLSERAVNLYDIDLTQKIAFVFGNENRGVSEEAAELADNVFYIPMRGMIQSLNVSVAAAVTLYEAQRQRALKGMYEKSELSEEEIEKLIDEWCRK